VTSDLVHVLLEGTSDVAAVRVAAGLAGRDPAAVTLVDMRGATNARRLLGDLVPAGHSVLGLCDRNEAPYVLRALNHVGYDVRDVESLPRHGFWVCDRDLEEELIRAVGASRALEVLESTRLSASFATFTRQPAWADRPFPDQLRRFAGAGSGRKELLAGALTAALTFDELPPPLAGLVSAFPA
jgi:hypothetical protein